MKRSLLFIAVIACTAATSAKGLSDQNGMFVKIGAGFTPIHIEEIIDTNELASGATVMSAHSSVHIGSVIENNYAIFGLAEHNWYTDAAGSIYAVGLTGIGGSYYVPDFYNLYFIAGLGLSQKIVFGGNLSASGTGSHLGFGASLSEHFSIETSFSHLTINEVISTYATGDSESINSVQLTLNYSWH